MTDQAYPNQSHLLKLVIRHVQLNLTKVLLTSLQLSKLRITYKVAGKRLKRTAGFSLEIPFILTCTGLERVVVWIQRKVNEK